MSSKRQPTSGYEGTTQQNVVVRTLRQWILRPFRVASVQTVSPSFRLIGFDGDALRNAAWYPGQHIRVAMGTGFTLRTYTPMSWDLDNGRTQILVFLHGNGPGSTWARDISEGSICEVLGPSRSLSLRSADKRLVLFGDETCFGLAVALQSIISERSIKYLFEVSDIEESQRVLGLMGFHYATLIRRAADGGHLREAAGEICRLADDGYQCALTGNAQSIQHINKALKETRGRSLIVSVKPYWAVGKTGLD